MESAHPTISWTRFWACVCDCCGSLLQPPAGPVRAWTRDPRNWIFCCLLHLAVINSPLTVCVFACAGSDALESARKCAPRSKDQSDPTLDSGTGIVGLLVVVYPVSVERVMREPRFRRSRRLSIESRKQYHRQDPPAIMTSVQRTAY